ncbi:hypothetical protein [Autumnicola musiva]|uniref:Cytochrome c domain-containing protein n=1 Tax=Autumnicola musiva TaxID=3075589 RepID=A0ABU3DBF0_9FLAO|nr:hypothetical protein [Zunongwangia sp. F117]MDT0678694.1 hypothetical protein [Zunongwangia sp. F117]
MKIRNFINSFSTGRNVLLGIFILAIFISLGMARKNMQTTKYVDILQKKKDSTASKEAFAKVYKVLMHPRCLNCHPKGDIPLQGDDSHVHSMKPRRGKDGKGLYAMKCANCHQDTNTPGLHSPPGNPEWHLPPADMKMVFEGRSSSELAKQLVNKSKNGNKSIEELIEHADDTLVKAGWNPAEGLALPPLSHKEFKDAWITWLENGAYTPD